MIETWFPTLIYSDILTGYDNKSISKYCQDIKQKYPTKHKWRCNTYSSMGSDYELVKDEYFNSLVTNIANHVGKFAQTFGMGDCDVYVKEGWMNLAGTGSYQEYHIHTESHFSAVYYPAAPENCGDICFRSHEANFDMFPLNSKEQTSNTYKTTSYKAVESNLIIFRSNLLHMVEINNSLEDRISIAINFIVR